VSRARPGPARLGRAGRDLALAAVPDLGPPSAYLVLERGTPVYSSDGRRVGAVEHVLAAPDEDIFDGLVLDTSALPGGHRFVDASDVEEIYERGVVLAISAAEAGRLHEPSANPAAMKADPGEAPEGELERKLRRAWELLSGRR
jgi:hypothetical protein